ncbi:restriction endonuclease subunit S [Micrococcus luteus]|uniref:restriction endonuclease subunit S n=1 Tax=Micrococcus luteus TaxID=1270 RepID=UPI001F507723|nr:restriction endonuclease subunit S [Micrococcus luteus]
MGDLLFEISERPGGHEEIPVLTLTEKRGFVLQGERFSKRLATEDTSRYKLIEPGTFAFNPYLLWAGALAMNDLGFSGVASPLYPTFRVREGLDESYVYRILSAPGMVARYDSVAFGSVPRRRRTSVKDFLSLRVPELPSLDKQRRIAAILDRADEQRSRRRAQITHLMDLRSTVFEYLFPSPGKNVRPLGEVAAVSSGITKGRKVKEAVREVPYMAVANVQAGSLDLTGVKTIAATEAEISKYELREGDLLLTEGGDPDKLGRGTVWRGELPLALHQNHIFRVRLPEEGAVVIPEYLESYVASHAAKSYFLRSAKQTTGIASINSTQLKALPVPVPPFSVQREFAAVVAKIDAQRERIERALALEDELFASLQYRAFRGEL